eukprot:15355013-Ditylum_brightwellii.AAC.1
MLLPSIGFSLPAMLYTLSQTQQLDQLYMPQILKRQDLVTTTPRLSSTVMADPKEADSITSKHFTLHQDWLIS